MKDITQMTSVPKRLRETISTGDLSKLSDEKILKYLREYAELKYGPHKVVSKPSSDLTEKEKKFIRDNYKTTTQTDMANFIRVPVSRVGEYVRDLKADEYKEELNELVYDRYEAIGRKACYHEYFNLYMDLFKNLSSRRFATRYSEKEIDKIFIQECIKHGRTEEEAREIVKRANEEST